MPRQPRPDPGHLKPYIDSFALALRAAGKSARTVQMYVDGTAWFAGWAIQHAPDAAGDWVNLGVLGQDVVDTGGRPRSVRAPRPGRWAARWRT